MKKGAHLSTLLRSKKTIFSLEEIALLWNSPNTNATRVRLYAYVKKGELIHLRRGLYAKDKNYNPKELATSIYTPSYISFETVLRKAGVIFQHYDTIFVVSKWPKTITIDKYTFTFRKLKDAVLFNSTGIVSQGNYSAATAERAFLDMVYLFPNYYFDNLKSINWEKCGELVKIYGNKQLLKRLAKYRKNYA